jgi:uncharacterized membrane protein
MIDKHKRSVAKAIVYRCVGVVVLAIASWFVTKSVPETTAITLGYHAVSLCGYYIHERLWERVKWGRS